MTCAFAVRGAIKKFAGVESVDVSLNKGLATVKLKPGNHLKIEELWETVRKNGFTPKETNLLVKGTLEGRQLKVTITNQVFEVVPHATTPKVLDAFAVRSTGDALVRGTIIPAKESAAKSPLQVRSIEIGR